MFKRITKFFTAYKELQQLKQKHIKHTAYLQKKLEDSEDHIAELKKLVAKSNECRLQDNRRFHEINAKLEAAKKEVQNLRKGREADNNPLPRGHESRSNRKLKRELFNLRRRTDKLISLEGMLIEAAQTYDRYLQHPTAPNVDACHAEGLRLLKVLYRKYNQTK